MSCLAGGPVQIAYGVDDVRKAAHQWAQLGAGPFFVRDHIEVSAARIFGAAGEFDHSSAYGQWGPLMVELISVHNQASLHNSGIHHVAYFVDSFKSATEELRGSGWEEALYGRAGSVDFAFHDARADLGHFVEIYEGGAPLRKFYEMVRQSSVNWDGDNPVRPITGRGSQTRQG